jgi:hypothetical protein
VTVTKHIASEVLTAAATDHDELRLDGAAIEWEEMGEELLDELQRYPVALAVLSVARLTRGTPELEPVEEDLDDACAALTASEAAGLLRAARRIVDRLAPGELRPRPVRSARSLRRCGGR